MPRWGVHVQCTYYMYVHIVPEHFKTGCRVCCMRYKLWCTCTLLYLWHVSIFALFCTCSCQTDIDECVNATCLNNATCVDLVNDYECNCTEEYFGNECEISVSVTAFMLLFSIHKVAYTHTPWSTSSAYLLRIVTLCDVSQHTGATALVMYGYHVMSSHWQPATNFLSVADYRDANIEHWLCAN